MKNNEKMELDDYVRTALENFAQPYNAEHWTSMIEQIDALDAADAAFDQSLRGRLADISALPTAGAWSKMADKLDDLAAADASFDSALRGRLVDVSAMPSGSDWSKMSAQLDDFNDAETEFDEILRKKLENIAGKYPNHWAMMNERLDRELTLKGKIVRYKVIEVALMLFAFFTALNVLDFNTEGSFEKLKIKNLELKTTTPQASELDIKHLELDKTATSPASESDNKNVENAAPQTIESDNAASKTRQSSLNSTLPNAVKDVKTFDNSPNWRLRGGIQRIQGAQNKKQREENSLQNTQPNQQPNLTPTGQPIVDNSVKNGGNTEGSDFKNETLQQVVNADLPKAVLADKSVGKTADKAAENVDNNAEKLATVNQTIAEVVAPINILQANLLNNSSLDMPINLIKTNGDKKGRWRLSVFGTAALDWVTTSFVYKREQHFQKQGVPSAGINALIAYRWGKIELETGLMLNQKKYRIDNAEVTTGSVVLRSTKIEKPLDVRLSIISIPLNLNVKLKETRRWDVYAHTGVATNAIVDAFDRRNITKKVNTDPAPITVSSAPPDPTPVNEVTLASYSKGLTNGGETRDNVFFTGHIGLGIAYRLTTKTSLFLQPTASFMLDSKRGIGNLDDRIQTYSIQAGAKWRL